jgi:uncharacterized repeat protein (TIGR02543 family)
MKKFPSRESGRLMARALKRLQIRRATLFVTLFALLLSTFTFVNIPSVRAATVGSGVCAQTVSSETGVSVTRSGNDCIVTFTSGTNNNWTVPTGVSAVRALVVGGGGGGGAWVGGGGGGGGFRDVSSVAVTPDSTVAVTVGSGGTPAVASGGQYNNIVGTNGGESKFGAILAAGGGKGGSHDPTGGTLSASLKPTDGGSGGGGTGRGVQSSAGYVTLSTGALGNTPSTSPSQGNAGGNGHVGSVWVAGGGGGAGGAGGNATSTSGGAGGAGASSNITGSTVLYAGGGGGIVYNSTSGAGSGGTGGGGAGGANTTGVSGTANTGGGGGGGGSNTSQTSTGGSGGSGIVIVRYTIFTAGSGACSQSYTQSGTGTVTVAESNGYCYLAFRNTGAVNSQTTFSLRKPSNIGAVDYLVVGGGGGGALRHGGGGGAGGLLKGSLNTSSLSSLSLTVGAGGSGATLASANPNNFGPGTTGKDSSLQTVVAKGGGGGNTGGSSSQVGLTGGSGGGALAVNAGGSPTSGQGFAGGGGVGGVSPYPAGGGGGAGGAGTAGSGTTAGAGGAGATWNSLFTPTIAQSLGWPSTSAQYSGNQVFFAGGGGGGVIGGTAGTASAGGGAGSNSSSGSAGLADSGGGGGGSSCCTDAPGGDGGSGVIVLRYATGTALSYNASDINSYESTSTAISDLSGNSVSATASAGITFDSTSHAWNFSGGTNAAGPFIDVSDINSSKFSSGFTIDFEADFGAQKNGFERIIDLGEGGEANDNIIVSRDGTTSNLFAEVWIGGTSSRCTFLNGISENVMTRYTVTIDGSTCRVFKDGATTANHSSSFTALPTSGVTLSSNYIGKSNWSADAQYEGKIRSLRIFSGGLTPTDISAFSYKAITYAANSGSVSPASATTSGTLRLATPTRTGYTFDGWYEASNLSGSALSATYTPTQARTVYAKWNANSYTLTFDSNSGTAVTASNFVFGQSVAKPTDPTRTGKFFGGWSTTETSNQGNLADRISSWPYAPVAPNPTLYAIWNDDHSLTFAGTNAASARNSATALIPSRDSFTWEAWIYPTGVSGSGGTKYSTILDNRDDLNNYGRVWLYIIDSGAGPYISSGYYATDATGTSLTSDANSVVFNRWQHVAVTIDRPNVTGSNMVMRIYIDGVNVKSQTVTGMGNTRALNSLGFAIGDNEDPDQQFKGRIDQVKIWDGALSDAEVSASRSAYSTSGVDNTLRAHYDFNDVIASPALNNTIDNVASDASTYDLSVYAASSANVTSNVSRTQNLFSVTYDGNSATSGSVSSATSISPYASVTLPSGSALSRNGYNFGGWNTSSAGSGTNYVVGDSYQMLYGDKTVYAKWTANIYTVAYAAGTGATGLNQTTSKTHATSLTLAKGAQANSWFTKSGSYVVGWSTSDGGAKTHELGGSFTTEAATTLYPVWSANYYANLTSGSPGSAGTTGKTYRVQSILVPNKSSFTLEGWFFDKPTATGQNPIYSQGKTTNNSFTVMTNGSTDSRSLVVFFSGNSVIVDGVTRGTWHHFAVTRQGLNYVIYVDGVQRATGTLSSDSYVDDASTYSLIGENAYYLSPGKHVYHGYLDQIKVWNGPLTSSQVSTSMHGYGASGITSPSLTNLFDFNDQSGTTLRDQVGTTNLTVDGSGTLGFTEFSLTTTFDSNGGTSVSSSNFHNHNLVTEPTAPTRTNHTFNGWTTTLNDISTLVTFPYAPWPFAAETLYANWTSTNVTVTFKSNYTGGASDTTQSVPLSTATALTSNTFTRTGYTFAGWTVNADGTGTSYTNGQNVTLAGALTLHAKWTANTYTITYSYNNATGGNSTATSSFTVDGTAITLPVPTRTGYAFNGWFEASNLSGSALGSTYSPTQSLTIYAKWTANTYTVTYNYDNATGGNSTATADFTVDGTAITLPTPTKTGYTFAGWHSDAGKTVSVGNAGASYSPTASLTLYAKWTEITYTITYNANSATGSPERATDTYTYTGGAVTLATIGTMTKTGYRFDGWQVTGTTTKLSSTYTPSANVTLEARWAAASYTITYFSNSGGTAPNADTYVTGSTALTLPTQGSMARTGYTFNGWSTTINDVSTKIAGSETSATLTTSAPVNLFALWTAINYTVTYCEESTCSNPAAFSGSVPVDANTYNIGNNVVVKANSGNLARTGYSFAGWTIDSDGSGTALKSGQTYEVQSSNIRFYPQWSANTYTFTYNTNGATGSPVRATDTYITGNSATTLAGVGSMAKFGHTFSGWSTDPMGSGQTSATTTSDVTLYAIWTVNSIQYTYRLGTVDSTAVNENFMSLVPSPLVANSSFNTSTTLSSRIDSTYVTGGSTYQFFGWRDNINGQTYNPGSSYLIQTESDIDFVAQWVQILEVRYAFNGGTGSAGNTAAEAECTQVGNTCLAGQTITLNTAPTRDGYTFTGWKDQTGADFVAGTSATVSNTSYLFYAQWQAVPYTMSFNSNGGNATVADQVKNIGQSFTFPSPGTRAGYDFNGWIRSDIVNSPTYGTGTTYVTGSSSIPFTASWTPHTYTVAYNWNGGVGSPTSPADYTVGQTAITLPTGTNTRDGYIFDGWQAAGTTTKLTSPYAPTANTLLEARWLDGAYVITFDNFNGSANTTSSVTRATALTLPTPTRTGFSFAGWYQDSSYTLLYGQGGASVTPTATGTVYAKWTQNSLVGINPAHLNSLVELTMVSNSASLWTGSHTLSGTAAELSIPANALPAGTKVNVSFVEDLSRPASLIDGNNAYFTSVAVHWLSGTGASATVPDAVSGSPLSLKLTNPAIVAGAKVFKIVNGAVTEVATATRDGEVTITFTQDPEFVVAATRPGSPTAVTATNNQNAQSTISWNAPLGNGGSSITGYTVTATPGTGTCTTTGTSCQITGLTNNTSYTFTVKATNAIGDSAASSPSSAITPRLAINYNVTFNSNGGTSVGNSSFVENGTLSAPTDPTRSGFNFIGWATTDGNESTIISFPYSPSNTDLTLYAIWRASNPALNPDNSGNNGAVITPISTKASATPTPKASASAKPTTKATSSAKPTSTSSPAATPEPTPTPKDLFANAPKPNAGIDTPDQGNANAIIGDTSVETVVTVTEFEQQIEIGDSISISFQATDAAGNQIPTSPNGSVQVVQGATINASGTGFKPDSPVEAWLYSTPVLLGSGLANADGSFDNTYAIDSDFPLGDHTVVLHGISPTDEVITLALGVTVIADEAASPGNTLLIGILAFLGALLTVGLWLVLRRRSGTHKK